MVSLFKSFRNGFTRFGHFIVNIVNFALLLFVYILGIGPVSIIGRIFRKEFLDLGDKKKDTCWIDKEPIKEGSNYRMF